MAASSNIVLSSNARLRSLQHQQANISAISAAQDNVAAASTAEAPASQTYGEFPEAAASSNEDLQQQQQLMFRGSGNCPVCNRFFLRNADLRRHMIVHTNERPFPCKYCSYRARQSGALARHVRIRHFSVLEH